MAAAADTRIIAIFIRSSFADAPMAALPSPPIQCHTFGRNPLAEQPRRALTVSGGRAVCRRYPCS
jgi:hypothetical protein